MDYRLPKQLDREVFAQWVDPAKLALLDDEQHRTIVLLLAYTGVRVSSVVMLARDALQLGPDGHPYLRYVNVKAKREAMLPIALALSDQLAAPGERCWPSATRRAPTWLLPSRPSGEHNGKGGACHISPRTVRRIVKRYVRVARIRAADGELALGVHPHLFRHHVGTSMVNEKIPLTVIQKVLDHGSIEMTAHYARLHDETVKREVDRWHERVNIRGERIALPIDGPLGEAAWMKERIARARQALPNGYCGLPLVQTCPHPNACLSCDSFLTDGSFRAGARAAAGRDTRGCSPAARENDNLRLVEVLERDEQSLSRILAGLDAIDADHADRERLELRDLAGTGEGDAA